MSAKLTLKLLIFGLLALPVGAQVSVTPIVQPHVTFVNGAGLPCAACQLFTYAAGTTTPLATYTDASGTSQNANPITLDAAGGANIWLGANAYKFILKDALGNTIWSADQVNSARLFPCSPANAIQIANSAVNALTCDSTITINPVTHTINVGTLPLNHVTIGALGAPTTWTFDTTSPATALASLGGAAVVNGLTGQLGYYAANGNTISPTSALPNGTTATTQSGSDNSTKVATTAYVAAPGAISPGSVAIAGGSSMTDNQGTGAKVQHSTGAVVAGNCPKFDANGNVVDAGISCASAVTRTCNANGCYRVEGDGTIEQWGRVGPLGSGSLPTLAVTFPTTFSSGAVIAGQVAVHTDLDHRCTTGSDSGTGVWPTVLTATGFTAAAEVDGGTCPGSTVYVYWSAVGY